ncbi:TadE/TadG family type IV pilus assembly protein [Paraburkholderia sp.]|uniref:TadE/TadG family type IV pilus assembly protein n=1 Tax=Paraburkholderia sp. TaxID=1926495 RepID=UPI002F3E64B8
MNAPSARPLRRRLRTLLQDNRGVTAIEFAIAAPVMLVMILASLELGMGMLMDASILVAANEASRYGLTTTAPATGTRASQAQQIVMNIIGGWGNIPGTTISIAEIDYGTFANVGTSSNTSGMGGLGDVVSYNISITTNGLSGILPTLGLTPITYSSNFIVQNEP